MSKQERLYWTRAFGVRAPIVRSGDDIVTFVSDALAAAADSMNLPIENRDIIGVTEALVARAQGNYANLDDITQDIKAKFPNKVMGVILPILSRNRFALLLKAMSAGVDKLYLQLSYPFDEVGNAVVSLDKVLQSGLNPQVDTLTEAEFYKVFGRDNKHCFTGIDYVEFYKSLAPNIEIIFSSNPKTILNYTTDVLCADIHSRFRTKKILKEAGAKIVYGMDDVLASSIGGSGYNPQYGILGSNMATEERVKLFPRDCVNIVNKIQARIKETTGKTVEVMIYGDGGFKDPVGGIWELADPVISPGFTKGLEGTPSEVKIKFLADGQFQSLTGKELEQSIKKAIVEKDNDIANMAKEGTTPRRIPDLVGSLCDLMSGSGSKGTPIIWVKNYFDDYTHQ